MPITPFPDSFTRFRHGTLVCWVRADVTLDLTQVNTVADISQLLARREQVPSSKLAKVYRGTLAGTERKVPEVYLKVFADRPTSLRTLFRKNRALKSLEGDRLLTTAGVVAPTTLAFGWRQRCFTRRQYFSISAALEGYRDLYRIADSLSQLSLAGKRKSLRKLAEEVARLHAAGIVHGDLRAGNILAKGSGDGIEMALLDNERTKRFRRLPDRLRIKNLVQLNMLRSPNISNHDRLYFFCCYCHIFPELDKRKLLEKVAKKTRVRLQRLVDRGRMAAGEVAT